MIFIDGVSLQHVAKNCQQGLFVVVVVDAAAVVDDVVVEVLVVFDDVSAQTFTSVFR